MAFRLLSNKLPVRALCNSISFQNMSNSLPAQVEQAKQRFLRMSIDQKRLQYKCQQQFITLDKIPKWSDDQQAQPPTAADSLKYLVDTEINKVVSLFRGDLTALEIDCIVNAANARLASGGGMLKQGGQLKMNCGFSLLIYYPVRCRWCHSFGRWC